ncbi:MAG: polysaccharide deacetylase family protein [Phototrophicaceae bacterium]
MKKFCLSLVILLLVLVLGQSSLAMDNTLRRIRVPILMYHYISELPPHADEIRRNLTLSPAIFEAHLQYLSDNGYQTVTLEMLDLALTTGYPLPERAVVLTFDDGYIDHYQTVFPALQKFGFVGTFFLVSGRIDHHDPAYLSWDQANEMRMAGMEMSPHTKTHLGLVGRDYDFLLYEILGSLESVQSHTLSTNQFFAYPAGQYDPFTLEVLQHIGITRAVTTQMGNLHTTDNRYEMSRLRINHDTSVAGLAYLLQLK